MNMALEGETPYDNANLFGYLMRHMSIIESTTHIHLKFATLSPWGSDCYNAAFYTTDGMRFEISRDNEQFTNLHLHESDVMPCTRGMSGDNIVGNIYTCGGCGSYGLNNNTDGTTKPPCLIMVDVNGDRKPNPANVNCKVRECAAQRKYSDTMGLKLTDMFTIMITDKEAIPFGVAAQRAMYQAQK